ncbi:hypothetical protein [Cupriavidus basilensis]|uniref:hypothetical protein n=1 Tax=Cupriavidus basilensis TaxID=68895 RepID=UPI0023E786AF|nr:hypothetical protein [Cupriavidus basilensis]MDF3881956.1 hypothetical protein [Cupriavidus basilensis]
MQTALLKTLLSTALVCASAMTVLPAQATAPRDSTFPGDKYGYDLHQGKRDPFTDGARFDRSRDPFSDGARANGPSAPPADISHAASVLPGSIQLAGMDRTGPSAPPGHGSAPADSMPA